jgi:hypothetical protein
MQKLVVVVVVLVALCARVGARELSTTG